MKAWLCEKVWRAGVSLCFASMRWAGKIQPGDEASISLRVSRPYLYQEGTVQPLISFDDVTVEGKVTIN